MQVVPLSAIPSQSVTTTLGNQSCQINVYAKLTGLFVDLFVNNEPIQYGMLGQNLRPMILSAYLGFIGELVFVDLQGTSDPVYTGLGSRFQLVYLLPDELPTTFKYQ